MSEIYDEDELERKEFVDKLHNYVKTNSENGDTILLSGKYGSGKSTVLKYFIETIEERNNTSDKEKIFEIVNYNAWENNFFENPLIPIVCKIQKIYDEKYKAYTVTSELYKKANNIFEDSLIHLAKSVHIDLSSLKDNEDIFSQYNNYFKAIKEFHLNLIELAKEKPLIILVDELDRCLPKYQIKVLETLYNLFDVNNIPNVTVIIAIDKEQLEETIRREFGNQKNIYGYLSKFISKEFLLPSNIKLKYISLHLCTEISDYSESIYKMCLEMFNAVNYSFRDIEKVINEANIVYNQIEKYNWYDTLFIVFFIIVRNENCKIFKKYFLKLVDFGNKKYYQTSNRLFTSSKFQKFINDVKDTKLENLIKVIQYTSNKTPFILHLINYIDDLGKLNNIDILRFLHINSKDKDSFRYKISEIIDKNCYYDYKI